MNDKIFRIAVAGGGITGLSAAFYIRKLCRERGISAEVTLIEQSDRLGGKVKTLHKDGCVIEQGPDSFLARKMPIIDLTRELGLEHELTAINPQAKTYIFHKDKLHRMPQGLMLGIPTEVMPFVRTGLIGPLGKARAAFDLVLPKRTANDDETLGGFLRRRLGSEVLEQIAEPLLAGIYAGDADMLSLQATFPQFGELEQKYGSLILGMIRNKKLQRKSAGVSSSGPSIAKGAMFLTYKKGLSTLIEALTGQLQHNIRIISGQTVTEITKTDDGTRIRLQDRSEQVYDAAIVAVPNYEAGSILKPMDTASRLIDVPYASVANVVIAYRRSEVASAMSGSGFVVPRREGLTITACTWTSVKWQHSAPDDIALVRCYVGRYGDDRGLRLSDEELVFSVRQDLKRTMGVTAEPLFVEPTRWKRSMPQYPIGHLDRLKSFREQLVQALPGVFVAGSGYQGIGLPDCIGQGKQAAEQAVRFLES